MRTIPLGISVSPTSINCPCFLNLRKPIPFTSSSSSSSSSRLSNSTDDCSLVSIAKSDFVLFTLWVLLFLGFIIKLFVAKLPKLQKMGVCKASQVVDLFPTVSPEIVVREARIEDCWEVAETHCSSFFPEYSFPLDFVLRIDRLVALLAGFSVPSGCRRTCLVGVIGSSIHETVLFGSEDLKICGFDGKFSLNRGYVAGILTVDTVADFLPRKGPLRQRRTGIAYISNVAVRERFRRKGIAKRLIAKAEAQAWSWGCRAIALHCDLNNPGATKLYKTQGFKCIKVPEGANWPQPRTSPDVNFSFMMKLLNTPTSA